LHVCMMAPGPAEAVPDVPSGSPSADLFDAAVQGIFAAFGRRVECMATSAGGKPSATEMQVRVCLDALLGKYELTLRERHGWEFLRQQEEGLARARRCWQRRAAFMRQVLETEFQDEQTKASRAMVEERSALATREETIAAREKAHLQREQELAARHAQLVAEEKECTARERRLAVREASGKEMTEEQKKTAERLAAWESRLADVERSLGTRNALMDGDSCTAKSCGSTDSTPRKDLLSGVLARVLRFPP